MLIVTIVGIPNEGALGACDRFGVDYGGGDRDLRAAVANGTQPVAIHVAF